MVEKLTDEQARASFDKHYPFIEQNEGPPGRWQEDDRPGRSWSGKLGWRTRHGASIVGWSLGRPKFVWGADLAAGTHRGESPVYLQYFGTWRYLISDDPRRWVHGTVDIRTDGVTFTAGEQPKYIPPVQSERPDLEADLASDAALRERLLDNDFADALYLYLKNEAFFKEGRDQIWSVRMRHVAAIVANLRGQGDIYIDYYDHRSYEAPLTAHFPEIKAILAGLGWRLATKEDFEMIEMDRD
jgi:hypothetical protein